MSTAAPAAAGSRGSDPSGQEPLAPFSTLQNLLRLGVIAVADTLALLLAVSLLRDGNVFLSFTIFAIAVILSLINLRNSLRPLRWMTPALGLVMLLVIYPMFYTLYVAFTNYSDGHRYTKLEVVERLSDETYLPEGGISYSWEVYRNDAGDYALLLIDADGKQFFAAPDSALVPIEGTDAPDTFQGFSHLTGGERFRALNAIQDLHFGPPDAPIGIQSRSAAGAFIPRWQYDAAKDTLTDLQTGIIYTADNQIGQFTAPDGSTAPLGFWVMVGLDNFSRILNSPVISGPLARIFLWTVAFALFSVITSFVAGLLMALVLHKPFAGVRVVRSLLIIPYAVPGMISILIWRGMLNPNVGVIATSFTNAFGWTPPFFTDAGWAKIAVLLVNLWLTYPYFMLVCSGALQAIPTAIYEAADVDGATGWDKFWNLTLPLLLVSTGPLLIASFTFNFTNFLLIEGLFRGGPPMAGTSAPPVGHTDTLISYTFRFAFSAGGTRDYGFASAIAIVIFFIVGTITLIQFRFTRRLEEIGENV